MAVALALDGLLQIVSVSLPLLQNMPSPQPLHPLSQHFEPASPGEFNKNHHF